MPDGTLSVAVVIPNRNDARYLPACLSSVLGQRRPPDEVIFVDDQSTDDSVVRARSLLSDCPVARIVENPAKLGTAGALNVGLRLAQSEFVLFLSSNDFISPELLARATSCLGACRSVGIWSAMMWDVYERGDRRLYPSAVIAQRDACFPPSVCRRLAYKLGSWFTTIIYNRKALLEIDGFDASLEGLSDLFAALVLADRRGAAFSPAPLGIRRIHEDSLLSSTLCSDQKLAAVVQQFQRRGKELAPELFTRRMLARTELRLHFASVRASGGTTLPYVLSRTGAVKRALITALAMPASSRLRRLILGPIFAVMRPFDLVPTIRYRLLGSLIVRVRETAEAKARH